MRVGIDVVAVARFAQVHQVLSARVFHATEAEGSAERRAGTFAVKEAVAKALGAVPPPWLEMTVTRSRSGKPRVVLSPALAARGEILDVSVAHDGGVAAAVALVRQRAGAENPP